MANPNINLNRPVDRSLLGKGNLSIGDLKYTHPLYRYNYNEWRFLKASYAGPRFLVRYGFITRHARESQTNFNRRMQEIYGFNYTKSIVDLFNFYLFKKEASRNLGTLGKDDLWQMFVNDCNLFGDSFDSYVVYLGLWASLFGHMGVLVDKAPGQFENRQQEKENGIYPYLASYTPLNILDWEFDRHPTTNRPYLKYLKLRDDDGYFRLWWIDHWEVWKFPDELEDKVVLGDELDINMVDTFDGMEAELVNFGPNNLLEIPFVWLYNLKSQRFPIGISDVHDISRIDLSIMRNLSQGEEIINFAAFPMMRKPKKEAAIDGNIVSPKEDLVGTQAVLEFDPDKPDSKPDWLESKVQEPLDAIMRWLVQKVNEIYRASNAGGVAATEISRQARSGVALKTEFLLLNSKLVNKAVNVEKAELRIMELWCRWQRQEELFNEVSNERSRTYEVEDLAEDLANMLTARTIVVSDKFDELIQKKVVRLTLPTITEDDEAIIDSEIEENLQESTMSAFADQENEDVTGIDENEGEIQEDVVEEIEVE